MSWLRIEGRMPQHHKVAPLSDAAFRLHMTAMAWSVEGKTDGKIPKAIPATLTRAPQGKKLKEALKELTDGGLWETTDAGFDIHDFLQWNLSAADIAARSEAKSRAGAAGGRRSGEARSKQSPSTSEPKPEAPASTVLPVAAKPFEAKPKPLSLSQSLPKSEEQQSPEVAVVDGGKIPCPKDLQLTGDQRLTLVGAFIPEHAIDTLTTRFVANNVADPNDKRTLVTWRKCLSMAISGGWNNPKTRPKAPEESPTSGDLGDYGTSEEWAM